MPAGISYNLNQIGIPDELCNVKTIYRLMGGFNLEDSSLVAGSQLPPLAPLAVNLTTRKAVAVKNVKVYANAASNATTIKVNKNSLAYVGMFLGNASKGAQVTAIDKSNAAYDTLTISLTEAVTAGEVLFEIASAESTTPKNVANFLNYARTKVESGATVTAVGQVFEIKESVLEVPVATVDKTNLGARFMFV